MTLEPINDFFSNIKEKLTNPFFGTLIFVWLVRNWELVYSIFNFDECYTLETKKQYIIYYYADKSIYKELGCNIVIALLLMLLGYLMLFLTRAFTTWFDFTLMPWITGKIISSKVVQKELYDEVSKERNEYAEMYEEQRKLVRNSSKEFDQISKNFQDQSNMVAKQTKEINELNSNNNKLNSSYSELSTKLTNVSDELKNMKEKHITELNTLNFEIKRLNKINKHSERDLKEFYDLFEDKNFINNLVDFPLKVSYAANLLKRDEKIRQFSTVAKFLIKGGSIDSILLKEMVKYNVVYKMESDDNNLDIYEYQLTPIGWILYNNWSKFFA